MVAPPLALRLLSVAAAAEDEQSDDQDPDPVITKEIAQTAVIHNRTSVVVIWVEVETLPALPYYDGCREMLPFYVE